jgi:hypothetical protein
MQALSVAEQVDQSSLVGSNNVEIWNQCRIECPTPLTELLFIPCDLFWNVIQLQIPYCRDLAQPTAACGLIYCNLIPGMHDNSHRRSKSTHKAEPQKYHSQWQAEVARNQSLMQLDDDQYTPLT